jgi:hypothetical protein
MTTRFVTSLLGLYPNPRLQREPRVPHEVR